MSHSLSTDETIEKELNQLILQSECGDVREAVRDIQRLKKLDDPVSVGIVRGWTQHYADIKARERAEREAAAAKVEAEKIEAVAVAQRQAEAAAFHERAMQDPLLKALYSILGAMSVARPEFKQPAYEALHAFAVERLDGDKQ